MEDYIIRIDSKREVTNLNRDTDLHRIDSINQNQHNKNKDEIISIFKSVINKAFKDGLAANDFNMIINEETLKVKIPKDVIGRLKDGSAEFLSDKQGELLPSIVGKDGKILRQIRLEDLGKQLTPEKISKLNNMVIQQQLANIYSKLEDIEECVEKINKGQRNDRYGKIESGIYLYRQAINSSNEMIKNNVISNAMQSISDGINSIKKEVEDNVDYFNNIPGEKTFKYYANLFIKKYTSTKIEKKAKELSENIYYMTLGVYSLIQIHSDLNDLEQQKHIVLEPLKKVMLEVTKADILSWLPYDNENKWQYELIEGAEKNIERINNSVFGFFNSEYTLEFNDIKLLEEVSNE